MTGGPDPTFEEIEKILNDEDIERLTKGILFAMKDITQSTAKQYTTHSEIYHKMDLHGYHEKVVDFVCNKHLFPARLIEVKSDGENSVKLAITEKGRRRVDQIGETDDFLWKETMKRISERRSKFQTTAPIPAPAGIDLLTLTTSKKNTVNFNFEKMRQRLESLTNLDIITARVPSDLLKDDPKNIEISKVLQNPSVDVIARTIIELEGDILTQVPMSFNEKTDAALFSIHKEVSSSAVGLWSGMVSTTADLINTLLSRSSNFVRTIGDVQNIVGRVHDGGFEIDLKTMDTGKKYRFEYEESLYDALKNDKGELDLYEIGVKSE